MNDLTQYQAIRDQIQSGDVIAFQGNDTLAKLIQTETNSNYSHVGMVIRFTSANDKYDRIMILESITDPGVILWPLSNKLANYSGKAWWCGLSFDLKRINLSEAMRIEKRESMITWGMNQIGKKYNFTEIGKIVRDILTKSNKKEPEDYQQFICSELVCAVLESQGLLTIGTTSEDMTPNDVLHLDVIKTPVSLI